MGFTAGSRIKGVQMLYYSSFQAARIAGMPWWKFIFMGCPRRYCSPYGRMYREDDLIRWCIENEMGSEAELYLRKDREKGW